MGTRAVVAARAAVSTAITRIPTSRSDTGPEASGGAGLRAERCAHAIEDHARGAEAELGFAVGVPGTVTADRFARRKCRHVGAKTTEPGRPQTEARGVGIVWLARDVPPQRAGIRL